jgi:hypothetical protein
MFLKRRAYKKEFRKAASGEVPFKRQNQQQWTT